MPGLGTKLVRKDLVSPAPEWRLGSASPAISTDEVHIWKIDLSVAIEIDPRSVLSADEIDHASRFHLGKDRQRFEIAHAALRVILGRYLNLAPETLVFAKTDYGKPFLVNHEAAGVLFNLAYSKDLALIAVAREREVGIDVEFIDPDFASNEVAEHFFSIAEIFTLSGLDPNIRTQAFFNCWTRKEAYVKARGGLSFALDEFDVALAPGVTAAMLSNRFDETETSRWTFHELQNPQYSGALVIESLTTVPQLSYFVLAS